MFLSHFSLETARLVIRTRDRYIRWAIHRRSVVFAACALLMVGCSQGRSAAPAATLPERPEVSMSTVAVTSTTFEFDFPPLSSPVEVAAYFEEAGGPMIEFLRLVGMIEVATRPDLTACRELIDQLSAGLSPTDLATLASGIPDEVLSALVVDIITAVDEYLTRCTTPTEISADLVNRLTTTRAAITSRLDAFK